MAAESTGSQSVEALRQAELLRREERRLARERGDIPGLRARFRAQRHQLPTVRPDSPAEGPQQPSEAVAILPPRVTAILKRVAAEVGATPEGLAAATAPGADAVGLLSAAADYCWTLLPQLPPLAALGYLVELSASGLPLLKDEALLRAEALRSGRVPPPAVDPENVDAWQLHLEAVEASQRAVLSSAAWRRLLERLPLPVVDDLIDHGKITSKLRPESWPGRSERLLYVMARVTPESVTEEQAEALGWQDELRRRALLAGENVPELDGRPDQWSLRASLIAGHVDALDAIEADVLERLPAPLAELVTSLKRLRRGAPVPRDLSNDLSLFALLERCLRPDRLITGRSSFTYWAGVRRLYRLLQDMHWTMAAEPNGTEAAARLVTQQASALRNDGKGRFAGKADREARAVQAYLSFLTARPGNKERLDRGIGLVEEALRSTMNRSSNADRSDIRSLERLSKLLHRLRQTGKPQEVLNPYLALCVAAGVPNWKQGWRDLRKVVPPNRLEYINHAKDRIQRIEAGRRTGARPEPLYDLPVDSRFLQVPELRSSPLHPPATGMPRRSAPSTPQDVGWSAQAAARQIIETASCASRRGN